MRTYQCKPTGHDGDGWQDIEAETPEEAAEVFTEEHGEFAGHCVTVRGVGVFSIDREITYTARRKLA